MQTTKLRSRLCNRLLCILFLFFIGFYSNAQANKHPVTVNGINIPLKVVFKAIKKQTGFVVMYNTTITALNQEEKITVKFKNTPLEQVLTYLLKEKGLEWVYNDEVIVIFKRAATQPIENGSDSTVTPMMLTGKVTDAIGSPLSGATIQVKGSLQGTTTDEEGRFVLPKVANGEVLVISSVGFETRSLTVKGRSVLVQLDIKISALDETVIIAYGETTKRMLVGNVSTLKGEDIAKQPVNNPLLALQGRLPGLLVTQNTGVPGGDITVRVQGQNSIGSGNDPLYVIDGVPYPGRLPMLGYGSILGNAGGNPLSLINPADIASIDVLKDADATAIYGSRAANGAILITTKKGTVGKMKVDVDIQHGLLEVARKVKMLDTRQYLDMRYEAYKNDNINWRQPSESANDLKVWDTTRYTDWQTTLIGSTAQYTNINLSVSGGTARNRYVVGGTWHQETSVFPGTFKDQKASVHFNLNNSSEDQKVSIQLSGSYMLDRNRLPAVDLTEAAIGLEPNAPALYNNDGTLNWAPDGAGTSTWINPLANYTLQKNKTNNNSLIGNLLINYKLAPFIEVRCSAGYTNIESNSIVTTPLTSWRPELRPFYVRGATYGNSNFSSWIVEPQVLYKALIGKGSFEGLLGSSIQQTRNNYSTITGFGHSTDLLLEDIKSAASLNATSNDRTYKYNALFGRLNYNWENKYIINVTARRDGSSRFGANNRFHNFASVGFAWIFTQEKYVQQKLRCISFGKLRGSYGTTGNDQIGDYSFLSTYNAIYSDIAYQSTAGLNIVGLPNPYLKWEENRKLQAGMDLGFFDDRILLNMTYARNRSSNQLLRYALPSITGFSSISQNFPATVQNTSWEFLINTVNLRSDKFNWTSGINLTIPRNKLVSFPNLAASNYAKSLIVGQPLTTVRVTRFMGVDPTTGLYQVADIHGNPTFSPTYPDDYNIFINTLPKFYGGIQNSVTYNGIQLDFLFQFVKQTGLNSLYYSGLSVPGEFVRGFSNQPTTVLDRWQKPGDSRPIQRYSTALLSLSNLGSSDASYGDASFVRLKTLSVSWALPERWLHKLRLNNLDFYLRGQNLLTITRYQGLDPETQNMTALPPLRTIVIGIKAAL